MTGILVLSSNLDKLATNPIFQLSLASKELFHSNFIYWLATNPATTSLFNNIFDFTYDPNKHVALREHNNFDFCICEKSGNKPGKVLFLLENKFKSIPYVEQLELYEEHCKDISDKKYKVLLTLADSFPNKNQIAKSWTILSYKDLAKQLGSVNDNDSNVIIRLYKDYIDTVSSYFESELNKSSLQWKQLKEGAENLMNLRLHDVWQKLFISKAAVCLSSQLQKISKEKNYDFHIGKEEKTFRKSSFVLMRTNYTRGNAILEVFIFKKGDDYVKGIQIQSVQYRHCICSDSDLIVSGIYKLTPAQETFVAALDKVSGSFISAQMPQDGKYNRYGNKFVYRYRKLNLEQTVCDVIKTIVADVNNNL